jgi:putative Holliday junction resolvase
MKGRILAVDYGSRRVGVALSDPLRVLARGFATLSNDAALIDSLLDIIRSEEVTLILVGMPYAPDGGLGKTGQEVQRFIDRLAERTSVPVSTWDESQSTRRAQQALIDAGMKQARRRRREKLDEVAARIMLQEYLDAPGS